MAAGFAAGATIATANPMQRLVSLAVQGTGAVHGAAPGRKGARSNTGKYYLFVTMVFSCVCTVGNATAFWQVHEVAGSGARAIAGNAIMGRAAGMAVDAASGTKGTILAVNVLAEVRHRRTHGAVADARGLGAAGYHFAAIERRPQAVEALSVEERGTTRI